MISGFGGFGNKEIPKDIITHGQTVKYAIIATTAINTIIIVTEKVLILNYTLPPLVLFRLRPSNDSLSLFVYYFYQPVGFVKVILELFRVVIKI